MAAQLPGTREDLEQQIAELRRELAEAREQQAATGEILRIIAGSPTDLQPVMDAVAENAARLCEVDDAFISLLDGELLVPWASYGPMGGDFGTGEGLRVGRGSVRGRAVMEAKTIHVHDLAAERDGEYPESTAKQAGIRTYLATPLLREGRPIGTISIRRMEPRPFSDSQVALLETFADQAVIAIENARLFQELQDRNTELTEALEQQTATSEILRAIASSPTDLQPVLDAVAESASRLCGASDATLMRIEDGALMPVAMHGPALGPAIEGTMALREAGGLPINRDSVVARSVIDRRSVHVADLAAEPEAEYPVSMAYQSQFGYRTMLATPLLREGTPIGAIGIRRFEVRPFTEKQIALLETFADQAVIAIENTRLFRELEERNRDLTEALEQQTATGEILRVIASSPTDLQTVLETVAENAARLCDADNAIIGRRDGGTFRMVVSYGPMPAPIGEELPVRRGTVGGRAMIEGRTIHVHDLAAVSDTEYPDARELQQRFHTRTMLATPLLREGAAIGAIIIRRAEVRPFTDNQIALVETFADQAVIAIENTRLFQELEERNRELQESHRQVSEALEQQTATAEILRVIASSPSDLQPVLDAIAASAVRLCAGQDAAIHLIREGRLQPVAGSGPIPKLLPDGEAGLPIDRASVSGRAAVDRRTVHVHDMLAESEADYPISAALQRRWGFRTVLATPLLREGVPIGDILIRRLEVRPFSEQQIKLLESFADQAVIAIENARLFRELEERNRDLTEALEQQTATSEILGVIASSPTELQPVLDAIAESAARVCGGESVMIFRVHGDIVQAEALYGPIPGVLGPDNARPIGRATVHGRAIVERRSVHVHDLAAEVETEFPDLARVQQLRGTRTVLGTPLLREGAPIGAIVIRRTEVRPFTDKQIQMLETFADQAVIAIENARLFQELEDRTRELARSVEELRALSEVGQAVSSSLDLQQVLETVVARAVELSGADGGAIYELDEPSGEFRLRATHRMTEELMAVVQRTRMTVDRSNPLGAAAMTRAPVQLPDLLEEPADAGPEPNPVMEALRQSGFRAVMAVPLVREERVVGGLVVRRRAPGAFDPAIVDLVQTFASQSVLAIENARLFQELSEKSRQLEIASQHKSQFLANMSHELRTPLNAILGYTELILDSIYGDPPEPIRDVLERVQQNGRHLLGLINDVLDLSRIEAGRLTLALDEYSMEQVVQTVYTATEPLAAEKGLTLTTAIQPDLPIGRGDERRLTQVLLNLVGNAIKFTESGRVSIGASAADGHFAIAVRDTGPGIAEDEQGRIFEEFQQADSSSTRAKGGTGLGLAISRRIIALHGGRLSVESRLGEGSTFSFTLPVRVERQAEMV